MTTRLYREAGGGYDYPLPHRQLPEEMGRDPVAALDYGPRPPSPFHQAGQPTPFHQVPDDHKQNHKTSNMTPPECRRGRRTLGRNGGGAGVRCLATPTAPTSAPYLRNLLLGSPGCATSQHHGPPHQTKHLFSFFLEITQVDRMIYTATVGSHGAKKSTDM